MKPMFGYYKKYYTSEEWDKELLQYRLDKREKEIRDLNIRKEEVHDEIEAIREVLKNK